ncbi:MAG: DUF1573 domain-containing protein [Candidatus Omnitrophota bacterium]
MKTTILAKILTIFLFLSLITLHPGLGFALEISPQAINLGDIPKNKVIKREIQIKNDEPQLIILQKARSSCDCVTIEYEKGRQLKENEIYKISLSLNTAELSEGKLKKFIFLYFKNAKNPIYSLELSGNIQSF